MLRQTTLSVLLIAYGTYKYLNTVTDSPIVSTSSGKLVGLVSISRDGRPFFEFLGVPYAKPPVGSLRFENPQAPEKWESIRKAQQLGAQCAQLNMMTVLTPFITGDEDCLFLNIYTPEISKDRKLPVLVFIHGGLFVSGSSNMFGPHYFMDEDVVLVTINYRLGSLGFLNTNDGVVRGNMGLKDQVMALSWIQQNIESFGGDPRLVTIFGESAGGASVHYHILSPMSKGLFQGAISQSGTSLDSWALQANPVEQAKRFARKLNCPTTDTVKMVSCLKNVPVTDILESHQEMTNPYRELITLFGPTVEKVFDDETFLPENPIDIIKAGKHNRVRWMAGINSEEGHSFSTTIVRSEENLRIFETNFTEVTPNFIFHRHGDATHKTEFMAKVRDFYFENGRIDTIDKFANYTNLITDHLWALGLSDSIRHQAQFSPVYAYYFTYQGVFSATSLLMAIKGKYWPIVEALMYAVNSYFGTSVEYPGVCHGAELVLLFRMNDLFHIKPSSKDYQMSRNLINLWTSFARNVTPSIQGKNWPPVSQDGKVVKYLKLDINFEIIEEPNVDRLIFWRTNARNMQKA